MKVLMWHCKDGIVAMITVEPHDEEESISNAYEEILQFSRDTKSGNVVVMPFVHISRKIAKGDTTLQVMVAIERSVGKVLRACRSHYGHHKELLLHTYGHRTNVRFREISGFRPMTR